MERCKIIIRDGSQMIAHPNGQEIPRLISTKVYQTLYYPPSVEVELFTDKRINGAVVHFTDSEEFKMPTGENIPGIDPKTIRKIDSDTERFSFIISCEF